MSAGMTGRLRRSEGATLVEFSMVAFLFVIVLLGVVEMGRMVLVYTALNDAARAGVRYAIVHGKDNTSSAVSITCGTSCTGVNTIVNEFAGTGLINTANVTTTVGFPNSSNKAGQPVTVTVTYTYDPIVSYFSSKLAVNMGATSEGVIVY
jgi:Flp pilus assembly protein TadG